MLFRGIKTLQQNKKTPKRAPPFCCESLPMRTAFLLQEEARGSLRRSVGRESLGGIPQLHKEGQAGNAKRHPLRHSRPWEARAVGDAGIHGETIPAGEWRLQPQPDVHQGQAISVSISLHESAPGSGYYIWQYIIVLKCIKARVYLSVYHSIKVH